LVAGLGSHSSDEGSIIVFDKDYNYDFNLYIDWPEYNALNGEARIATGDIDGDKKKEFIIGLGPVEEDSSIPAGRFQILDDDYKLLTWGQVEWSDYNKVNGETWPACGDVDGDGKDEIVIGFGIEGKGQIAIFDYESGAVQHKDWIYVGWDEYSIESGETRPACGNIDLDKKDEIIIGLGPVESDSSIPAGMFQVLDDDYELLAWGQIDWSEFNELDGATWPACGDVDFDSRDEIIVGLGSGGGGRVEIFDYALKDKEVKHKDWIEVAWDDYSEEYGETRPASGNIDSDWKDEIIVGLGPGGAGWLQLFDGTFNEYGSLAHIQIPSEKYNTEQGESWPAIAGAKTRPMWFKLLINAMRDKMLNKNR
jgi:hypothetical protein